MLGVRHGIDMLGARSRIALTHERLIRGIAGREDEVDLWDRKDVRPKQARIAPAARTQQHEPSLARKDAFDERFNGRNARVAVELVSATAQWIFGYYGECLYAERAMSGGPVKTLM